jgi:hypothetical protein
LVFRFLDAMVPAWTALAQTAASPKPRMGFMYLPHGAIMEHWTPAAEGKSFELTPILKPFAPFQKQLTIVSGLENKPRLRRHGARAESRHVVELCDAARGTGSVRRRDGRSDRGRAHRSGHPLPSLEVATEGRGGGGACDRNYGCSYGATISFRTPTTPLPMESDPRKLFERLFGQGDTAQERKAISKQYTSILDLVTQEAADLQKTLDAPDRAKLGDYLESVREIERRVQKMEAQDLSSLDLPESPSERRSTSGSI